MRDYRLMIAFVEMVATTSPDTVLWQESTASDCCFKQQNQLNGRQTYINTGVNRRENFTRRTLIKYLCKLITRCSQATDLSSSRNQKLLAEQHSQT